MTNQWVEWGDFQTQMAKWQQSYSASSAWATKTSLFVWNIGYCHWLSSITGWEDIKNLSICLSMSIPFSLLGMDQYLLIPFLGGWTSIYQLFWCELQGYKVLTHCLLILPSKEPLPQRAPLGMRTAKSTSPLRRIASRRHAGRWWISYIIYHIIYYSLYIIC